MTILISSSTLRSILPRAELRRFDRQPGAYPVQAKTGDRTRSGKNPHYFDDGRTIVFSTGTLITYPTTLPSGSFHLRPLFGQDLTSSLPDTTGSVNKLAVDQFVLFHEQTESPGPFIDSKLYEQDEVNLVNSSFMTGTAFFLSPDRFKAKLANKTAIRIENVLTKVSVLTPNSSSLHYFNPVSGGFDLIKNENGNMGRNDELNQITSPANLVPFYMDPVLFSPYGYMHRHPNGVINQVDSHVEISDWLQSIIFASEDPTIEFPKKINQVAGQTQRTSGFTASLLNANHAANSSQSIKLSQYISHPFFLEKAVIEFPVEAGPGWLNDAFQILPIENESTNSLGTAVGSITLDVGGPMVTVGLLRQDRTGHRDRDLIASATFTTARDIVTASYAVVTGVLYAGAQTDISIMRVGLSGTVNTQMVLSGSSISGSNNFYTGTVKLNFEPSVTHHVMRCIASGSSHSSYYNWPGTFATGYFPHFDRSYLGTFGNISRRPGTSQTGRSLLGNNISLLKRADINGSVLVRRYETDYENLPNLSPPVAPQLGLFVYKWKEYHDIVSKSTQSPYLLYPEDELIICINKHRSVSTKCDFGNNGSIGPSRIISGVVAQHDIKIPTGTFSITLYGDLIRNDIEFHDTLNQRLETSEIFQTVGEEPVLDQFDVAYTDELSGSFTDRFSILSAVPYAALSSSLFTTRLFGNGTQITTDFLPWSPQYSWSTNKYAYELKKSNKFTSFNSDNEIFWDCRLPRPNELLKATKANYRLPVLEGGRPIAMLTTRPSILNFNVTASLSDWMMAYPYEGRYSNVSTVFDLRGNGDPFTWFNPITSTEKLEFLPYDSFTFQFGAGTSNDQKELCIEGNRTIGGVTQSDTLPVSEFVKYFYGMGDGFADLENQYVKPRTHLNFSGIAFVADFDGAGYANCTADPRGWRYGMMSGFPMRSRAHWRRNRYGQPRDMLEQRLFGKFFDDVGLASDGNLGGQIGVTVGAVQVRFYNPAGTVTDALRTLSSNVSFEATSSVPYTDGVARNRPALDLSILNIANIAV